MFNNFQTVLKFPTTLNYKIYINPLKVTEGRVCNIHTYILYKDTSMQLSKKLSIKIVKNFLKKIPEQLKANI